MAACLVSWVVFLPLLGPGLALFGLLIPFTVFFPLPSVAGLRDVPVARIDIGWSWRSLLRLRAVAPAVALSACFAGALFVVPDGPSLLWAAAGALLVELVLFAGFGGLEIRILPAPDVPGATVSKPPGEPWPVWSLVTSALSVAVGCGLCSWMVRKHARSQLAGTERPVSVSAGHIVRWADRQLSAGVFGPTYDRHAYWTLLVAAAGLLSAGCCLVLRNAWVRTTAGHDPFEVGAGEPGTSGEASGKVFLSYSRKDTAFARALCDRLEGRLGELWIDWQAIRPSQEWRGAIAEGIRSSDAFVVLLSRDALASTYCWDECRQAIEQRKRILPVLIDPKLKYGSTSGLMKERGWGELTSYQNLSLVGCDEQELGERVEDIVAFVHQHHRWVSFHARLAVLAHQWWESGRNDGLLLRSDELAVAEAWRQHTPDEADFRSGLTDRQLRYLTDSRRSVRRRAARIRSGLAAGLAAILALGGLVAAGQTGAEVQYREALSRKLAAIVNDTSEADPERALQYALAARGQADTTEARNAMAEQLTRLNQARTVIAPGNKRVDALLFSPKGDILLITRDGNTEIWDVRRARSRGTFAGRLLYSGTSYSRSVSSDGRTAALESADGSRIDLVDTTTLRIINSFPSTSTRVLGGGLSTDGTRLIMETFPDASGTSNTTVWDVPAHRLVRTLNCVVMTLAPSGQRGLCNYGDRETLLDLTRPDAARDSDIGNGDAVGFTTDDGMLLNVNGEAHYYAPGSAHRQTPVPHMAVESDRADGPLLFQGRYAVFSRDGKAPFELWDLRRHRRIGSASSADKAVALRRGDGAPRVQPAQSGADAENEDGSLVATAAVDESVVVWTTHGSGRISDRLPLPEEDASDGQAQALYAVSQDARLVARASGRSVGLWDTRTGKPAGKVTLDGVGLVSAFSRDDSLLAVAVELGAGRKRVEVFGVRDHRRRARFEAAPDRRHSLAALIFSPDGKRLYAVQTGQANVVVWDVGHSGERGRTVATSDGYADDAALSPDGKRIAVEGRASGVSVWNTATHTRQRFIRGAGSAVFSPDGASLATTDEAARAVSLWRVDNGKKIGADLVPASGAYRVRFAPDRWHLAIVGSPAGDLTTRIPVTLWDLAARRPVGAPIATADDSTALAFTPDGSRVVTAGRFGSVVVRITPAERLAALCELVTRRISAAEWQAVAPGERLRWPCP